MPAIDALAIGALAVAMLAGSVDAPVGAVAAALDVTVPKWQVNTVDWQIDVTRQTVVTVSEQNPREFTIADPQSKARFIEVLGDGARWLNELEQLKGQLKGGARSTTSDVVAELGSAEANRPEQVLRHQGYLTKRSLNSGGKWQQRWIVLQGRTIYWFHGADKLKGQLELTSGTLVQRYEDAQAERSESFARSGSFNPRESGEARPFTLVVQTPELRAVGLVGLLLQCDSEEARKEWAIAIREAVPGFHVEVLRASQAEETSVLESAIVQGILSKKNIHRGRMWQRRWFALGGNTLYWFSGYYKVKGSMVLTDGTQLVDERVNGEKRPVGAESRRPPRRVMSRAMRVSGSVREW